MSRGKRREKWWRCGVKGYTARGVWIGRAQVMWGPFEYTWSVSFAAGRCIYLNSRVAHHQHARNPRNPLVSFLPCVMPVFPSRSPSFTFSGSHVLPIWNNETRGGRGHDDAHWKGLFSLVPGIRTGQRSERNKPHGAYIAAFPIFSLSLSLSLVPLPGKEAILHTSPYVIDARLLLQPLSASVPSSCCPIVLSFFIFFYHASRHLKFQV